MRIIHTADLHLGQIIYQHYDRTAEHLHFFGQLTKWCSDIHPDALLVSGDIFDIQQPSATVRKNFTDWFVQLHHKCPQMKIVLIAGNHDSATRIQSDKAVWDLANTHLIGLSPSVERLMDADGWQDDYIIRLNSGYIVALPYMNGERQELIQSILNRVAEENKEGKPVVLMGHLAVAESDVTGHNFVGTIKMQDVSMMGNGYDYLALGHIHHGQFIHSGKHNVRYCGTPIPVSFDENYKHSVSIVEIDCHGEKPTVKEIEINPYRPLVTLPTEGVATWEDAKELLENYPDDIEAYIRLNVEVDDFLPVEANAEAHMICEDKKCRFCVINSRRLKKDRREAKVMSVQEFKTEEPIGIAERYAEDLGIEFDNDMKELFNETLAALKDEERM
jgi:exonuclease SbcD